MKVNMSKEGKILHDELIDELDKVSYINFDKHDGKNKIFHVTITSKKIQKIFYLKNVVMQVDSLVYPQDWGKYAIYSSNKKDYTRVLDTIVW